MKGISFFNNSDKPVYIKLENVSDGENFFAESKIQIWENKNISVNNETLLKIYINYGNEIFESLIPTQTDFSFIIKNGNLFYNEISIPNIVHKKNNNILKYILIFVLLFFIIWISQKFLF